MLHTNIADTYIVMDKIQSRGAEYHFVEGHNAESCKSEYHYAEGYFSECRYAEVFNS